MTEPTSIEWFDTGPDIACGIGRYTPGRADLSETDREMLPQNLLSAHPKRQSEFLAGRMMVGECTHRLSLPYFLPERGTQGAPVWPDGISGSISHSHGMVASALTTRKDHPIGLDVEKIVSEKQFQAISKVTLSEAERAWIVDAEPNDRFRLATAVFSAKESFYKAVWPIVRYRFGFSHAEIEPFTTASPVLFLRASAEISAFLKTSIWPVHVLHRDDYVMTSIGVFRH